ncbi:MAG: LamG-like jellyroll fold domain-containing protein [Planctomycetota bacterium]|nr:LamG-like jellyroll fold domain-containing protein [Planctomycetota bacterium]
MSWGGRGATRDSATSSREQERRDGWTRVTVRWDADGTTVHAGGWAYASGARPKGGIVIGGDNKVPFGGLIDEVRVWNRRLSDEELDA